VISNNPNILLPSFHDFKIACPKIRKESKANEHFLSFKTKTCPKKHGQARFFFFPNTGGMTVSSRTLVLKITSEPPSVHNFRFRTSGSKNLCEANR
jgi:hypothetical protein